MLRSLFYVFLIWAQGPIYTQAQVNLTPCTSTPIPSSLRGIAAVSKSICWVSGSEGAVFKTLDGGQSWVDCSPLGYGELQFRDIHAFGKDTVMIISAGLPAVICKTTNGGKSWRTVYKNQTEGVFFDAFDFWSPKRGIAFSDASAHRLLIIKTTDGGETWQELDSINSPKVHPKQGGFAASGSCLQTYGDSTVAIGVGGTSASVFISHNAGNSWLEVDSKLHFGPASAGVFSLYFAASNVLLAVGGDYTDDYASERSFSILARNGENWRVLNNVQAEHKYLSSVVAINLKQIIAVGRFGGLFSQTGGNSWQPLNGAYYALSLAADGSLWTSGPKGTVAKISYPVLSKIEE